MAERRLSWSHSARIAVASVDFTQASERTTQMMIVMKPTATEEEVQAVIERIESRRRAGAPRAAASEVTVIGAIGDREHVRAPRARGPRRASTRSSRSSSPTSSPRPQLRQGEPHRARDRRPQDRRRALRADRRPVHGRVARPDARDRRAIVKDAGATMFRGGAYKPRTSPYAFQGLGQEGLRLLAEAKARDRPADRHRADGRPRPRARRSRSPTSSRSARATCRTTRC